LAYLTTPLKKYQLQGVVRDGKLIMGVMEAYFWIQCQSGFI
jgi:hypothetical protein